MTKPTRSDFFASASGATCYVEAPHLSDIRIEDIATALSRISRFGGHTIKPYSVAAHSLLVSRLVPSEFALEGLLHDAAEAYLGDVIGPLKRVPAIAAAYGPIEEDWLEEIYERFRVRVSVRSIRAVKAADLLAIELERHDNLARGEVWGWWGDPVRPLGDRIDTWAGPELVCEKFLSRFRELTK